jgi:hypothetical protein
MGGVATFSDSHLYYYQHLWAGELVIPGYLQYDGRHSGISPAIDK